jgi:DNA-binding transcriptional MocR family regulator
MLDLARYQIGGSTAREIAASAEAAIRDGALRTGDPLPTVRALAERLGTSPATVNAAYQTLAQRGLVIAEGRRGTRVAPRPALRTPQPADLPAHLRDLAIGLPDPALLPSLPGALASVELEPKLRMSRLEENDPELLALAARWFTDDGLPPGAVAIVGGAFDGIERALSAHLRPGDRVVIEDPAYPSIRDLLLALGLNAVPVPVDERGLVPRALEAALRRGAEGAVIVPRAQNPFGAALDDERAFELRALLGTRPELLLIEDDHAALVGGAPFVSLAEDGRANWAVIRSVSKFLHPDLRLAMIAGDVATIARIEGRQALGTRWVSHILQATVHELMSAPGFDAAVGRAGDAYTDRRVGLVSALAEQGMHAHGHSGLNVWVPVREEAPVARALLDAGWLVMSGERFRIATEPGLRITITTLQPGEAEEIARIIAGAERLGRPRRSY